MVGEGITGSPVIGPAGAPGRRRRRWARSPTPGSATCSGRTATRASGASRTARHRVVDTVPPAATVHDSPAFPAVGHPAFGDFGGRRLVPGAGRGPEARARRGRQRVPAGRPGLRGRVETRDGRFRPGFPAVVNDLQFLTGPTVADLDGQAGEEVARRAPLRRTCTRCAPTAARSRQAWPKLTVRLDGRQPARRARFGKDTADAQGRGVAHPLGHGACLPHRRARVLALARGRASTTTRRTRATCAATPRRPEPRPMRGSRAGRCGSASPGDDLLCGRPGGLRAVDRRDQLRARVRADGGRRE